MRHEKSEIRPVPCRRWSPHELLRRADRLERPTTWERVEEIRRCFGEEEAELASFIATAALEAVIRSR
jgi:hypothetical protein